MCLREFSNYGLKFNHRAYEYLLRQSIMNAKRNFRQPKKVREAIFILTSSLIEKYFEDFRIEDPSLKGIEKSLRTHNFFKFEMTVHAYF